MAVMDTSTNGHPAEQDDDNDVLPSGWRLTLPRALGIAAFLAMAIFWIYAFANTNSIAHPDEFDDPVFSEAAESICAERQANIEALPLATVVENPVERADLIDLGTEQLELMVAEVAALDPPTVQQGADGVAAWLVDYELYLSDRNRYSALLRTGEDPAFTISGTADGVRVTDLLNTFAEVNNMRSCAPSGDV